MTTGANSIIRETSLSLAEAAKRIPPFRPGRSVTVSCLVRWILDGVRSPHGKVRLEAVRVGGRWITSVEALERFCVSLTPDLDNRPSLPCTPTARRRASERAARQLEQLGI